MARRPRVALVGTDFYGYIHSVARELARLDSLAGVVPYGNIRNRWRSLPRKLGTGLYERAYRRVIRDKAADAARGADWLLLFRGDLLKPDDLDFIRERTGVRIAVWLIDSVKSIRSGADFFARMNRVFCYNRDEVTVVGAGEPAASFLPLAYDPEAYHPIGGIEPDFDIYSVGTFHPDRMDFLEEFLEGVSEHGLTCVADGPLWSSLRPGRRRALKRSHPRLFASATNRAPRHSEINRMSQRARVCLNFLPAQATSALNIRAYEICGAGAFQLVNDNPVLGQLYEVGVEVTAFGTAKEAAEAALFFTSGSGEGKRRELARRGHRRALAEHTFERRVQTLLDTLA